MSVKLDIFNDIVTAVEAIVDINGIKVINTVELWNSQLENEEDEISFNFPAVFIEFAEIPWTSTNQQPSTLGTQGNVTKEQKGEGALVMIHISHSELDDETISFPVIDAVNDKIYFAIQGLFKNEKYSPLLRITELQDVDHERVIDWQMGFLTTMFQCGELDDTLIKIDGGTITLVLAKDLDIDNDTIRTGII